MRIQPLLIAAVAALALLTGCGDSGPSAAFPDAPARSTPAAATPEPSTSPTPSTPSDSTTPPPATETSAVSLDTQARLTAEGGLLLLQRCHAKTADYARCQSGATATQLTSHPSVPWGRGLGETRITATRDTFELDSHSYSGAHFLITRTPAGTTERTCRESRTECATGRWEAIAGVGASLRSAP